MHHVKWIVWFAILMVALFWQITKPHAEDKFGMPDLDHYFANLMQPDKAVSCCGWGDMYHADKTEACGPLDGMDCALVAIVTDTRPDRITLPDGRVLSRPHFDVGYRVPVPTRKVRKHPIPIPNPTDHNLIFFTQYDDGAVYVYCWEPVAGG